jgi:hypothetical protein
MGAIILIIELKYLKIGKFIYPVQWSDARNQGLFQLNVATKARPDRKIQSAKNIIRIGCDRLRDGAWLSH